MDVQVRAALHEECVGPAADALDRLQQVFDQDDIEGVESLKLEVVEQGILVAGSGWPECDECRADHV